MSELNRAELSATLAEVTWGELVESAHPGIVAKLATEGLLSLAVPERSLGIAIAADDGSSRALGLAAVAVIEQLELAQLTIVDTLRERHVKTVKTFGGEAVGEMCPAFHLEIG